VNGKFFLWSWDFEVNKHERAIKAVRMHIPPKCHCNVMKKAPLCSQGPRVLAARVRVPSRPLPALMLSTSPGGSRGDRRWPRWRWHHRFPWGSNSTNVLQIPQCWQLIEAKNFLLFAHIPLWLKRNSTDILGKRTATSCVGPFSRQTPNYASNPGSRETAVTLPCERSLQNHLPASITILLISFLSPQPLKIC